MGEFSNTDAELARCIKSRMRHEFNAMPYKQGREEIAAREIREYMQELCQEIINEDF